MSPKSSIPAPMDVGAIENLRSRVLSRISAPISSLIQDKHLYQTINVEVQSAFGDLLPKGDGSYVDGGVWSLFKQVGARWALPTPMLDDAFKAFVTKESPTPLTIPISDVKLFCIACDRIEPYNHKFSLDVLRLGYPPDGGYKSPRGIVQSFALTFVCQSCKGPPETFLIRREGMKLTLAGRSPMEHVPVDKLIPLSVRKYHSDSVVAHQCGQTLAALFLLRTLIEQFCHQSVGKPELLGDEAIKAYSEKLPDDYKKRFPSLGSIYSDLSKAIHEANASESVLLKASAEIHKHFKGRDAFELNDAASPSKGA